MIDRVSPGPHRHLLLSLLFISVVLVAASTCLPHGCDLSLSDGRRVGHVFICLCAVQVSSLMKCLLVSLAHFIIICFIAVSRGLCVFWTRVLSQICDWQILHYVLYLVFSFAGRWFSRAKVLKYEEFHFIASFLLRIMPLVAGLQTLHQILNPGDFLLCFLLKV